MMSDIAESLPAHVGQCGSCGFARAVEV
jgi:hypothetical protein